MAGIEIGALLDETGVFGNTTYEHHLMPIVYIDKITLENNSVPPLQLDNPHIVDTQQDVEELGAIGIGASLPPDYEQLAMQSTSDGCYVTVDLIVKDVISNTMLSSWFYDEQVLTYMKIKVIQSTKAGLTQALVNGQFTVLETAETLPDTIYAEKIISLVGDQGYYDTIQDFYTANETGSGLIASIPYQTSFQLDNSQPSHLAYFAYCYIDMETLSAEYNLSMYGYSNILGVISTNITSELVIENGTVVSQSYVFYTPEGTLWTGAVHQHDGVWMAGETHTTVSHPVLTLETVINTTIQDFRDIDAPLEMEINLKPIESILSQLVDKYDANEIRIEDSPAYFSDAFVARTELDGKVPSASFVFSFDFTEFIKQKSHFGSMMASSQNEAAKAEMLRLSKILSLKVYRYRATTQPSYNRVGSPIKGGMFKKNPYIGSEDPPILIIKASDNDNGVIPQTTNPIPENQVVGAPAEADGTIREIKLRGTSDIRTFAVTDFTMGTVTDGSYQYSVEVEIKDGTVEYLNDMLEEFTLANNKFSLYSNLSTTHEFYDANINQFKDEFYDYYVYQLGGEDAVDTEAPWIKATALFCHVLSVLGSLDSAGEMELYTQLLGLCNPATGTPKGISGVLAQMQKLEAILGSYLGNKNSVSINRTVQTDPSQTFEKFILRDTQFFNQLVDAEIPDKYGLEFIDKINKNQFSGPPTFTIDDYELRIREENAKYFKDNVLNLGNPVTVNIPDSVFTNLSTFGATYLTPVRADNGDSILFTKPEGYDLLAGLGKYSNFSVPMLNREAQKRGTAIPVPVGSTQANNEKLAFLRQLGISVNSVYEYNTSQQPATDILDDPPITGLISSINALGDTSLQISGDIEYSDFMNPNAEIVIEPDLQKLVSIFSSNLSLMQDEEMFDGVQYLARNSIQQVEVGCYNPAVGDCNIISHYLTPDGSYNSAAEAIPNQIKSLFLSFQEDLVKINWFEQDYDVANDPTTALMFLWNYQNIAKVEYLKNYESTTSEGEQVKSPIWEPLTFTALTGLKTNTGLILCRLVKYDDAINKIGYSKFAQMPYYNSYFLIASDQSVATSGGM